MTRRLLGSRTIAVNVAVALSMVAVVALVAVIVVRYVNRVPPGTPTLTSKGMVLHASEQFNGPEGAHPSAKLFAFDVGGGGWGRGELQVNTRNPENVRLTGTGELVIEVRKTGDSFTSARVVTRDKVHFGYGLLEARIKFPEGQGVHSSFWMRGANEASVGYPACGEIDVIEVMNSGEMYYNSVRGPMEADPAEEWSQSANRDSVSPLANNFRTYQIYRQRDEIRIGVDGYVVGEYRRSEIPPGARWVFEEPMYLLFNVAIGGDRPGRVDPSTPFPATMLIDWIQYWQ